MCAGRAESREAAQMVRESQGLLSIRPRYLKRSRRHSSVVGLVVLGPFFFDDLADFHAPQHPCCCHAMKLTAKIFVKNLS